MLTGFDMIMTKKKSKESRIKPKKSLFGTIVAAAFELGLIF